MRVGLFPGNRFMNFLGAEDDTKHNAGYGTASDGSVILRKVIRWRPGPVKGITGLQLPLL